MAFPIYLSTRTISSAQNRLEAENRTSAHIEVHNIRVPLFYTHPGIPIENRTRAVPYRGKGFIAEIEKFITKTFIERQLWPKRILIVGAGTLSDIPIEVFERCQEVVLADIDQETVIFGIKQLPPHYLKKVTIVIGDMSGVDFEQIIPLAAQDFEPFKIQEILGSSLKPLPFKDCSFDAVVFCAVASSMNIGATRKINHLIEETLGLPLPREEGHFSNGMPELQPTEDLLRKILRHQVSEFSRYLMPGGTAIMTVTKSTEIRYQGGHTRTREILPPAERVSAIVGHPQLSLEQGEEVAYANETISLLYERLVLKKR